MENESLVKLPEVPENYKKNLFLLEIGFIEVGFVLLLLIVVFGTLNYFNILKLSTAFSTLSVLSYLPSRQIPSPPYKAVMTNGNFSYVSYSSENAYIIFNEYTKTHLKTSFLPSTNVSAIKYSTKDSNSFAFFWKSQVGVNLFAQIIFSSPSGFFREAVISASEISNKNTLSPNSALQITQKYFMNAVDNFSCTFSKNKYIFWCKNSYQTTNGKEVNNVELHTPTRNVSIFSCFIPKQSDIYQGENSCKY